MIYEYLFTADLPVLLGGSTWASNEGKSTIPGESLLHTCKQIYAEAGHLVYKSNVFLLSLDFRVPGLRIRSRKNFAREIPEADNVRIDHDTPGHLTYKGDLEHLFSVKNIRFLELRLRGPDPHMRGGPNCRYTKYLANSQQDDIASYVEACVNRCRGLERLRIVCSGWSHFLGTVWLNEFIAQRMPDVICNGSIEWVQRSDESERTWIWTATQY